MPGPALVVLSTLFPSSAEPVAGIFIKERMFRVAQHLQVTVVSPQPWFPLQGLLRRWRPGYRPQRAVYERMQGVDVWRPRFLSLPGVGRRFDGFALAIASWWLLCRLRAAGRADVLDVHFGYPDGYGGALLARWLALPLVITLRGKEERLRQHPALRGRMSFAMRRAQRVIAVSEALREVGLELGAPPQHSLVIGNGIDVDKFHPLPQRAAREQLHIAADAKVLVCVGALGERKGFHRIIECLPELLREHAKLQLLIVGGPSPEGDWTERLHRMVAECGLGASVRFLGAMPPDQLRVPLSAADLFVLPTRYEGWANVLLEAMACGLPVVTTDVGGNAQVVCRDELGTIVPFGDRPRLMHAIDQALRRSWDRAAIRRYAESNTWDRRVQALLRVFDEVTATVV
jgi:teichuronic acid biosynthesis glycosyltransferase TuaC